MWLTSANAPDGTTGELSLSLFPFHDWAIRRKKGGSLADGSGHGGWRGWSSRRGLLTVIIIIINIIIR